MTSKSDGLTGTVVVGLVFEVVGWLAVSSGIGWLAMTFPKYFALIAAAVVVLWLALVMYRFVEDD